MKHLKGSRTNATDIGSWKTYTPVTANAGVSGGLSSYANQTGTRIYYVDPSQAAPASISAGVAAGEYYLWNGSAIIDSAGNTAPTSGPNTGVAYGSDPFNPSVAIKPYYRLGYCLPQRGGGNRVNGTVSAGNSAGIGTPQHTSGVGRNGMPDWYLVKRGTTLNLQDDLLELAHEGDGALTAQNMQSTLSLAGGSSLSAMSILGAYGPTSTARPIITQMPVGGFIAKWGSGATGTPKEMEFTAYVSITFDGYDRSHYTTADWFSAISILYASKTAGAKDVWFDDCAIGGTGGIVIQSNTNTIIEFFRSSLYDTYGGHNSGLFTDNSSGSQVNWYDSFIARNGKLDDPRAAGGGTNSTRDRNFYYSGIADATQQTMDNCVILAGGSGDQFRHGINLTRCYFMVPGVVLGGQGGDTTLAALANTGTIANSVFEAYASASDSVHGGGFAVFYGAHGVDAGYNVCTDAGMDPTLRTTYAGVSTIGVGGTANGWYHPLLDQTKNNRLHHNIIIDRAGTQGWGASEGIDPNQGLTGADTHFVNGNGTCSWNDLDIRTETTATASASTGATSISVASTASTQGWTFVAGWAVGITLTNGSTHWTTATNNPSGGTTINLANALPSGMSNGARVFYAKVITYTWQTTATRSNTFDFNTEIGLSNTSPNTGFYSLSSGGAPTPTDTRTDDTVYANNTHMTTAAATGAGYDIDRCLKSYLTSISVSVTNTSQDTIIRDLITYWKNNMRKGQYDPRLVGKAVASHVRLGVGLSAL